MSLLFLSVDSPTIARTIINITRPLTSSSNVTRTPRPGRIRYHVLLVGHPVVLCYVAGIMILRQTLYKLPIDARALLPTVVPGACNA